MIMRVAFTGRRPKDLVGYDHDKYLPLYNYLKEYVVTLYHAGYTEFITGGAQGFDQLVFWAVNSAKSRQHLPIRNIVYIPYEGQQSNWSVKGTFGQIEYNTMLKRADEVYCNPNAAKLDISQRFLARDRAMVDQANLVVGLYPTDEWNSPNCTGGTAYTLRYAKKKDKTIVRIGYNPELTEFTKNY